MGLPNYPTSRMIFLAIAQARQRRPSNTRPHDAVLAMGCPLKAAMGRFDGGLQLFLLLPLIAPRREV
jgi:hypothetical protein